MDNILDGMSMNIEQANMDKLKSVFPECFAEGKLDIDKLLSLCGEYIDNDFEKYKFEWKGKAECLRLAQKRSTGTLRPCPEESVHWDTTKNLYIEGDNLEVLKLLQTAYYRKVKMIYIDPPYNTGNDFVYEDNFADPLARYKEVTQQTTKSNPETMGRYHTNWLNMMYPRLRLAANLLKDDGVIFISIDENEVDNLKKLCNEVFGEENFVGNFIWKKKGTSTNVANAVVSALTEYILCYSKTNYPCLNRRKTSVDTRNYPFVDEEGKYRTTIIEKKDSGDYARETMKYPILGMFPREGKRWQIGEKKAREYEQKNRFLIDNGIVKLKIYDFEDNDTYSANPNLLLDYGSTDSANKFVNIGIFEMPELFSNPKPIELINHFVALGTNDKNDIILDFFSGSATTAHAVMLFEMPELFSNPKPIELINHFVALGTNDKNDIILDFFSGSATTAHAVMQLNAEDGGNRQFILVQLPEICDEKSEAYQAGYQNICEIGKERMRRAGKKIKEEFQIASGTEKLGMDSAHFAEDIAQTGKTAVENLDIGFKVFKLDSSNLKTWDNTPVTAEQMNLLYERMNDMVHRVKSDRSDLDGFKVFKLDSSNLKTWDNTPVTAEQMNLLYERMNDMVHRVKSDRSDLDMVCEIMLKLGVPLTYSITAIGINGKVAYAIGDDCLLLVCLAPNVQPEDIKQMAEFAPAKLIISRESFVDDTAMANAHYILKDHGVELKLV